MKNFNTNLKVGFRPLWAPTDQKALLCTVPAPHLLSLHNKLQTFCLNDHILQKWLKRCWKLDIFLFQNIFFNFSYMMRQVDGACA